MSSASTPCSVAADAARSSEGSGLGLALAKRITETLGGSIGVQSGPNHGARFAVLMPEMGSSPSPV